MSNFQLKCNKCNHVSISINKYNDIVWEDVEQSDRQMGQDICSEGAIDFDCKKCGNEIGITFREWEYPEGSINHSEEDLRNAELIE